MPGRHLDPLIDALRSCAEFGIDFQSASALRKELQRTLGFADPPSLIPITRLCSDLLMVALCNLIAGGHDDQGNHLEQLEQWVEFLVDFYLQETGQCGIKSANRLEIHLTESLPSSVPDSPVTDASLEHVDCTVGDTEPVNDPEQVRPEDGTVDVTPLVISDVPDDSVQRDLSDSAIVADTSIPIDPVDTDADVAVQLNTGDSLCVPEVNGTVPESPTNTDLVDSDVPVSNTARVVVEANVQDVPESSTECVPGTSDESDVPVIDVQQASTDATVPETDDVVNLVDESPPCSSRSSISLETSEDDDDDPDLNAQMAAVLEAYQRKMKQRSATRRLFPKTSSPFKFAQVNFGTFRGFSSFGQTFGHIPAFNLLETKLVLEQFQLFH